MRKCNILFGNDNHLQFDGKWEGNCFADSMNIREVSFLFDNSFCGQSAAALLSLAIQSWPLRYTEKLL